MILQVLSSIIPIVFLIVLGFILHEKQFLTKGLDRNLTFLVMNVALPASVFLSVVNNLTVKTLEELASRWQSDYSHLRQITVSLMY